MPDAVVEPTVTPTVKVEDTPEFKAAIKAARESLETSIRQSNQEHLAKKEQELEARIKAQQPSPTPQNGTGYFEQWGGKYGIDPEAGRELALGIVEHVKGVILPGHLKPITERQKRQEIREQRTELRNANPKLATLDDKYHDEALKMVEALPAEELGEKSYAKALNFVIGSHVEELMAAPKPEGNPEIVPGPEPTGSAPSPRKKVTLNAEQKRFIEERGFSEESFIEMMRDRARSLEAKGFTKVQVRERPGMGALLGTIEF